VVLPYRAFEFDGLAHPEQSRREAREADRDRCAGLAEAVGRVDHFQSLVGADDQASRGGRVGVDLDSGQ
jgi:hypothetical protein